MGRLRSVALLSWQSICGQQETFVNFIYANKNGSHKDYRYHASEFVYALRLATAINPSRPEPNNQTAAGIGTADTERLVS